MRTLVYSIQSAGASVFCLWLSQLQNSIGILDLYAGAGVVDYRNIWDGDIFLKVTASSTSLQQHIDAFQPDKTIVDCCRNNIYRLNFKKFEVSTV